MTSIIENIDIFMRGMLLGFTIACIIWGILMHREIFKKEKKL